MKTNGLRSKKPKCARAAIRVIDNGTQAYSLAAVFAVLNWHRAAGRN